MHEGQELLLQKIKTDDQWREFIFKYIDRIEREVKESRQESRDEISAVNETLRGLTARFDETRGAFKVAGIMAGIIGGATSSWITKKMTGE